MDPDDGLKLFAIQISKGPLGLARYRPEPWALVNRCFDNVVRMVEQSGSEPACGWTFRPHKNLEVGTYLSATHHCVWMAPNRTLVDITPLHEDELLRPITEGGDVLFLVDKRAEPVITEVSGMKILAPRPTRFFPLSNDKALVEYLRTLAERERLQCEEIYAGNIPEGYAREWGGAAPP